MSAHAFEPADLRAHLYLFRGPATPMEDFTPEQSAEQTRAWGVWLSRVGSALADGGAPFGAHWAVADDGSSPKPSDQNGYTIVEADSLDAARTLVKGRTPSCPRTRAGFIIENSNWYQCRCNLPALSNCGFAGVRRPRRPAV